MGVYALSKNINSIPVSQTANSQPCVMTEEFCSRYTEQIGNGRPPSRLEITQSYKLHHKFLATLWEKRAFQTLSKHLQRCFIKVSVAMQVQIKGLRIVNFISQISQLYVQNRIRTQFKIFDRTVVHV